MALTSIHWAVQTCIILGSTLSLLCISNVSAGPVISTLKIHLESIYFTICMATVIIQFTISTVLNPFEWVPCVHFTPFHPHHSRQGKIFKAETLLLLKHVQRLCTAIHVNSKLLPKAHKSVQIKHRVTFPPLISQSSTHYALTTLTPFQFFEHRLSLKDNAPLWRSFS